MTSEKRIPRREFLKKAVATAVFGDVFLSSCTHREEKILQKAKELKKKGKREEALRILKDSQIIEAERYFQEGLITLERGVGIWKEKVKKTLTEENIGGSHLERYLKKAINELNELEKEVKKNFDMAVELDHSYEKKVNDPKIYFDLGWIVKDGQYMDMVDFSSLKNTLRTHSKAEQELDLELFKRSYSKSSIYNNPEEVEKRKKLGLLPKHFDCSDEKIIAELKMFKSKNVILIYQSKVQDLELLATIEERPPHEVYRKLKGVKMKWYKSGYWLKKEDQLFKLFN